MIALFQKEVKNETKIVILILIATVLKKTLYLYLILNLGIIQKIHKSKIVIVVRV